MSEITEDKTKRIINRREFLKLMAAGAATTAAGLAAKASQDKKNEREMINDHEKAIQATVQALQTDNEPTSFKPEGPFTNEYYEKVKQATFIIDDSRQTDDSKIIAHSNGTCWVAEKDIDHIYLVTNGHVITEDSDYNIDISKPSSSQVKRVLRPYDVSIIRHPSKDLVVLKCKFPENDIEDIPVLKYTDNAHPQFGTKMLTVGFPSSFAYNNLTEGTISTYYGNTENTNGDIMLAGVNAHGASGSPITIPDEGGDPVAIGVVTAIDRKDPDQGGNKYQEEDVMIGSSLDIKPLIDALKST